MMDPRHQTERWWTPFPIATGQTVALELGPLAVRLHKASGEWYLHWEYEQEDEDDPVTAERTVSTEPLAIENFDRFVCGTDNTAALKPLLADRPIVVRPRQRVYVLPGEETTFYIGTPVWIRIEVGEPPRVLREIPVMRLSDTWFGPSTREGELCYAARTHARSSLQEVPRRPYRAITPVRIQNRALTQLPIDKLSLPVPLLSLYGNGEGELWTEGVSLTRASDSDMASLLVTSGPPHDAREAQLLTAPRIHPEKAGLVRAFSSLFG